MRRKVSRLHILLLPAVLSLTLLIAIVPQAHAADGLIGAWKLDEGSGTTVADSSGNANNGTVIRGTGTGSPFWVSPGHDASVPLALDFDGSGTTATATNTVNLGNAAVLDQLDNYTISLWVKFKPGYVGNGGPWANLVGRTSGSEFAYMIYVNNAGKIRPHHRNSDGTFVLTDSAMTMPVDQWVHIEQTADGNQLHLYINGVEDTNFPIAYSGTTYSLPSANTYIGQDTREFAPLATISDVKIYDDATTPPQVSTNTATDITQTSATLNGTISTLGDFTTANVFFRYRLSGSSDPYVETSPQTVTTTGAFGMGVSGLTPGVAYEFLPVAQWMGRDGMQEATGATSIFSTPTTPTAPAPATNLQAVADGTDRINLSWDTPNDNGSTLIGYQIERSLDGTSWSVIVANTGTTNTTYQDTDRAADTQYYYRVSAINTIGTAAVSNVASATTDKLASPEPSDGPSAEDGNHVEGGLASTGQNSIMIISTAVLLIVFGLGIVYKKKLSALLGR